MSEYQNGSPETETLERRFQPPGTIRVITNDGREYFLRPEELTPVEHPREEPRPPATPPSEPPPPLQVEEPQEPVPDENIRELTTQILAFNVENYDELNALAGISLEELQKMSAEERAAKEKEMQERFNVPARKFFEELVVHGATRGEYYFGIDAATDDQIVFNTTDLDGRGAVGLMRMAGVDVSKIEYVKKGDKIEGKTNLDTGEHWGLAVDVPDDIKDLSPEEIKEKCLKATVFIDHHGDKAKKGYSATKGVYETLLKLGMLEKTEVLDRTVDFITMEDNGEFPFEEYENSDKIFAGLAGRMKFKSARGKNGKFAPGIYEMMAYSIEHGKSLEEMAVLEFDEGLLKDWELDRASAEKRQEIAKSRKALREAEENGLIVESPDYGRILLDVGGRVKGGWKAAKCPTILGQPADVYIKWMPRTNNFFISASRDIDPQTAAVIQKQGGQIVRGNMAVTPSGEYEGGGGEEEEIRQTVSAGEILFAMGVPKSEIEKSRNRKDGSFNTRGLFRTIQDEQETTRKNPYQIPPRPQRR